jgi:hypothetical protein
MLLSLITAHCPLGTSLHVKKETRGVMGATPEAKTPGLQSLGGAGFTAEEKNACSLEVMMNGGTYVACQ